MPRRPPADTRVPGLFAALVLLLALPGVFPSHFGAEAQPLGGLLLPRGAFLLEVNGQFEQVSERLGEDGSERIGTPFGTPLTSARFPGLSAEEQALRLLLGDPGMELQAGQVSALTEINAQRIPMRVGYGLLGRVSLGATAPVVRRRADSALIVSSQGANVGRNPSQGEGQAGVQAFRTEAMEAFTAAARGVEERCLADGTASPACLAGQQDLERIQGFLTALDQAWSSRAYFPLLGSAPGSTLQARWNEVRSGLARWGGQGPAAIPLATAVDSRALGQTFIDPLGDSERFPRGVPEALYALGDAEFHLVVGLTGWEGLGRGLSAVHSAVEVTVRLPTGTLDSMAVLLPQEPLGGHGGVGVRWVSHVQPTSRLAVGLEAGWQRLEEGTGRLMATDPAFFWDPAPGGAEGSITPGNRQWVHISPRVILVTGLSLGVGYRWWNQGDDRWRVDAEEGILPGGTRHELSGELGFAGWHPPVVGGLPFPVELRFRGSRVVGGDPGMPVATVIELQARLLRRR